MKNLPALTPSLPRLFAVAVLFTFAVSHGQTAPAAQATAAAPVTAAPVRAPAQGRNSSWDSNPWLGDHPLPTPDERKLLLAVRDAAEKDRAVVIATRTYDERFGAADNLVRTLMFSNPAINNPAYKDRVFQFQVGQVLHPMMWSLDYENSRDLLWPDPNPGPLSDHLIVTKMSGTPGPSLPRAEAQAKELERLDAFDRSDDPRLRAEAQDMRAIDALNNIHQAALEDKDAQAAMQKVREAFQALDDAVRAAMKKDPAINELVEKYPNLFYGRRDLGLTAGGLFIQS